MPYPRKYSRRYSPYEIIENWFTAENSGAKRYSRRYGYRYGSRPAFVPVIQIRAYTTNKISGQAGFNQCNAWFKTNVRLTQWEARANGGGGHGVGLLVGSGGFVAAGEVVQFEVFDHELTFGDKEYLVTVYGRALLGGGWSG